MSIIDKPSDHFNTVLYTGNGSTQTISGAGFQPDFTWIKHRDGATAHMLFDILRGALYRLSTNNTNSQASAANTLTSWNSDGFALGSENDTNGGSRTFVSWNWKANGQGSSNTAGTINTTYTSANTTAGFSLIRYNGNGSNNATIGHGLGVAPNFIIVRRTDGNENWVVQNSVSGFSKYMYLDVTNAENSHSGDFVASVSDTLITLGTNGGVNNGSGQYICYAFANKNSFFKVGSYTGNGSANGTFVNTGFSPAFMMIKKTNGTSVWTMIDNKRNPINYVRRRLFANDSAAENTDDNDDFDFLSNGLKSRRAAGDWNSSGDTFIYIAFAQNPFVTSTSNASIPCTAR